MKIHFLQHESFEAPGAYEIWAKNHNHQISFTKSWENQKPPTEVDHDMLIILGGPQDPATTPDECPHFDAQAEINFIKQSIQANKKVVGICLGAQLIGEALGAKFDHSPEREIGLFPLQLTNQAKQDPFFSTLPTNIPSGHWHGDMPGLTQDAQILAFSEGCPRQVVKYTDRVYGFQNHFEFTPEVIELMITHCGHELEKYKNHTFVQNAQTLKANDYSQANQILFDFLDYLTAI